MDKVLRIYTDGYKLTKNVVFLDSMLMFTRVDNMPNIGAYFPNVKLIFIEYSKCDDIDILNNKIFPSLKFVMFYKCTVNNDLLHKLSAAKIISTISDNKNNSLRNASKYMDVVRDSEILSKFQYMIKGYYVKELGQPYNMESLFDSYPIPFCLNKKYKIVSTKPCNWLLYILLFIIIMSIMKFIFVVTVI